MKKLITTLLLIFTARIAMAGCPTNELIYNVLTPITFAFEKRNGTGKDTANTTNKRVAISYCSTADCTSASDIRWWNGTDWTSITEQLLTMTQKAGNRYYYPITPNSTVSGKYIMVDFEETDDVDVTMSCVTYVQPEDRLIVADDIGPTNQKLSNIKTDTAAILDDTGADGVVVASGSKTGYSLAADQSAVTIGTVNALGAQAKVDVNAEVDTALSDVNLDHLAGTATAIPAIPAGTYIDQMMDDGTAVYDRTTDSMQAIRDNTGAAGAGLTAIPWNAAWDAEVESEAIDALNAHATTCDISAATSGTSFTIATCVDENGAAITLATDMFVGSYMVATTNSGTQCNVVGQGVFVSDLTAGVVTVKETDMPGSGFSATPNTSNCGVRIHP